MPGEARAFTSGDGGSRWRRSGAVNPSPPETVQELLRRYASGERQFHGVDLSDADLSGVTLNGADFDGSWFFDTNFEGASYYGDTIHDGDRFPNV